MALAAVPESVRRIRPQLFLRAGKRFLFLAALFLLLPPATGYAMLEAQFLFFPAAEIHTTPAAVGLPFEDVNFAADDGTALHGWYLPGEEGQPLLLFCHGNAGNIADRIDLLAFFHRLGLPVFIFDYRGYGRSAGEPSEAGSYSDARGALAWLEGRGWSPQRMVYLGRSLGAGVALQLALERPPAALVLESAFTSVGAMGRLHYPLLARLLGWLLAADYDNLAKIPRLKAPLLLVYGTADRIVPDVMGEALFARAPEPKRLLLLPGVDHNDLYFVGHPEYRAAWLELLAGRQALSPPE
jgi:uncharacterized protein